MLPTSFLSTKSLKNAFHYLNKHILEISTILAVLFISKYVAMGNIKHALIPILLLLFLSILTNPLVGLIISVPLVLYFSYIDVLWVSPWDYILLFLVFIALLTILLRGKIKINKTSQKILLIFISYIFLATLINWTNNIPFEKFIYDDITLFSTLLLGFCTMFFIKNEKQLKTFIYSLIGFMSISAFVGTMQFLGFNSFWEIRESLGNLNPDILTRARASGLSLYSIPFSYELAATVPLIFSTLSLKVKKINKFYSILTFLICFFALLATKSRSAIIAGFLGLLAVTLPRPKLKFEKRRLIFLVLVSSITILILFNLSSSLSLTRFNFKDVSAITRISALYISGKTFLEHPFGTGKNFNFYKNYQNEFERLTYKYLNKFAPKRIKEFSSIMSEKGMISPHNYFLNILLYYGIFGFLLAVLFYYYIFKGLSRVYKNNKDIPFIRAIASGLIGSFTSYIINSLFHNSGPFLVDPFLWYFIGITLFLLNHYENPKKFPQPHKSSTN